MSVSLRFGATHWVWLLVALAVSALCSGAGAAERPIRVACVGDSITDGYQMPDKVHHSYPAQLAQLLGPGWEEAQLRTCW